MSVKSKNSIKFVVTIIISFCLCLFLSVSVFADSVDTSDSANYGLSIDEYNPLNVDDVLLMQSVQNFAQVYSLELSDSQYAQLYRAVQSIKYQLTGSTVDAVFANSPSIWSMMYKFYVMFGVDSQVNSNFELSGLNLYDLIFLTTYSLNGANVNHVPIASSLESINSILGQLSVDLGSSPALWQQMTASNLIRVKSNMGGSNVSDISVGQQTGSQYTLYYGGSNISGEGIIRFEVPLTWSTLNIDDVSLESVRLWNGSRFYASKVDDFYIQQSASNYFDLYLVNPSGFRSGYEYAITLNYNGQPYYYGLTNGKTYFLDGHSLAFNDYVTLIRQYHMWTIEKHIDTDLHSISFDLHTSSNFLESIDSKLDNLPSESPKYQAAKQASQDVIDDTLDNFTGNGKAAAKKSDTSSMAGVSSSISSGLNAGGSVEGATSVFSDSSSLWEWFSQSNYDNINGVPSPTRNGLLKAAPSVPVVPDVPDFYTLNQQELKSLLGGD